MSNNQSATTTQAQPIDQKTILALRHLTKRFGGVNALVDVDFTLQRGEIHGVIGENGAGKSTLMKILSGIYTEYEGEMLLNGQTTRFHSVADAQAQGIAMVHQELTIFPDLTIAENIFNGNQPTNAARIVDWKAMRKQATEHLQALGIGVDVNQPISSVSVGTQQMIEIARVIFSGAQILILDEPTSALSLPETVRLFSFMRQLKAQGKTLIFISHFLEDVLQVTDRVSVFRNGRRVTTSPTSELTKHKLIHLMLGSESRLLRQSYEEEAAVKRAQPEEVGAEVLSVQGLCYQRSLQDISFSLRAGEILGLYGFVGAGQQQLAHCLFGALHPTDGHIQLHEHKIRIRTTRQAKKLGIAYVPENRRHSLVLEQEIYKNVTLSHLEKVTPSLVLRRLELALTREKLQATHVRPPLPFLPVGALSGGNQQKVVLAKWLVRQPRVLILAEPTRGMDIGAKEEVLNLIHQMRASGVAILLITTELETILSNCSRVLVLSKGRITAELQGDQITKDQMLLHA